MKKFFSKTVLFSLSFILIITSFIITSCNKSESSLSSLSKEQILIKSAFNRFNPTIGDIDISTVKYANNGDPKLYIISAKLLGSETKKVFLKVDERNDLSPHLERFIFETNIPKNLKSENFSKFDGFASFASLDNNDATIKVNFKNGVIVNDKLASNQNLDSKVFKNVYFTPLTDCIKQKIRDMSFGDWVLFVAFEPESVAALVLACAIDVVVNS